jgi:hypothetical protein
LSLKEKAPCSLKQPASALNHQEEIQMKKEGALLQT